MAFHSYAIHIHFSTMKCRRAKKNYNEQMGQVIAKNMVIAEYSKLRIHRCKHLMKLMQKTLPSHCHGELPL